MKKSEIEQLNRLGDQLEAIYRPLSTRLYTSPLNRLEEKERLHSAWQKGQVYNPQFEYERPPTGWSEELETFLATFKPENPWARFLYDDAQHTVANLDAIETRDPAEMTELITDLYGPVDDDLLAAAYSLLTETAITKSTPGTIPAQEVADFLRQALVQVGLDIITPEICPMC